MENKHHGDFCPVTEEEKVTKNMLSTRLGLSILSIFLCIVIFCSSTFAWFVGQKTTPVNPVEAAAYEVKVSGNDSEIEEDTYICPLAYEDTHTVTLTAEGTASTGYCEISADGEIYAIQPLNQGESVTLTIRAAVGTEITFTANWGQCPAGGFGFSGREIYISETHCETYTVAEGVTLEEIAEYYGVFAEDILTYNDIWKIYPGLTIKIPCTTVTEPMAAVYNGAEETETTVETEEPAASTVVADDPLASAGQQDWTGEDESGEPWYEYEDPLSSPDSGI